MKKCINCGYIVNNDVEHCSNCNHSLADGEYIYICDKCGRIFGKHDLFCPNCGLKKFSVYRNVNSNRQKEPNRPVVSDDINNKQDKIKENINNVSAGISSTFQTIGTKIANFSEFIKTKFIDLKNNNSTQNFGISKKDVAVIAGVFVICTGLSAGIGYVIHDKEAVPEIQQIQNIEFTKVAAKKKMCSVIALNADMMDTPTVFGNKITTLAKFDEVEYVEDADSINKGKIITARPLVYYKGWKRKKITLPAGTPLQLQRRNSDNGYTCAFNIGDEVVTGDFSYDQIIIEHSGRWRKVIFNGKTGYVKDYELSSVVLK